MRGRRAALLGTAALSLFAGCGKRGDPLPPLARNPQPVTGLAVSQRGESLEVSYLAPRLTVSGQRLPVMEVELLHADGDGDLEQVATRVRRKAAPGETLTEALPLPPTGTPVRVAAKAWADGHASVLSAPVTFTVAPRVPPATELTAEARPEGIALQWTAPPPPSPSAPPPPSPSPTASPSPATSAASPSPASTPPSPMAPAPAPSPSASAVPSPAPSASPTPEAGPSPGSPAAPSPSASPAGAASPSPPPAWRFQVYRRASTGSTTEALLPTPATAAGHLDLAVPAGQAVCYQVRTVARTAPLVESAPTEEVCLIWQDVFPPAAPSGVTVLVGDDGAQVSWSASPEGDVTAYRLYREEAGGPSLVAEVPATETRYLVEDPAAEARYRLSAMDAAGNESPLSEPVEPVRP